jgi:hypothetical protein
MDNINMNTKLKMFLPKISTLHVRADWWPHLGQWTRLRQSTSSDGPTINDKTTKRQKCKLGESIRSADPNSQAIRGKQYLYTI